MSLTEPKNNLSHLGSIMNLCAVFALILDIFNPIYARAAETGLNFANSSQNSVQIVEDSLSESPASKLLNAAPSPDRIVAAVITVYTSTPDQTDDSPFYGARGTHVYDGMIAVNGLPFGTRIKIPTLYGDKIFTVDDRMNRRYSCAPKHCRMDIWLNATKKEAMKFGVKHLPAEIYFPVKELAAR